MKEEELKDRKQNQPTEEQMIIQRLRHLGLSILRRAL